jgi:hypothetical protein
MSATLPGSVDLQELVPTLTAELPQILAEVVGLLRQEWPDYAEFLASDPTDILATAELAVQHLVTLAQELPQPRPPSIDVEGLGESEIFRELGRIEWREGRSLGMLLSAYRAGARVAWHHLSGAAVDRGIDTATVAALAEAVFVFVEELSSASARGYVDEQRATAGERERLRGELAELLVSERSDTLTVQATALRAGWPMPGTAALILIEPDADVGALLSRLDPQALPMRYGGLTGVIVPDPDGPGRRRPMARALAGTGAVVGPTVALSQLPVTVRITAAGHRLAAAGVLTDDPTFVADHYDAIMLARDPWLQQRLREQVLAPLDGLSDTTRARLEETLAAWLAAMGDRQAAAAALKVHPQTVRYRLRQLQDLYGDDWLDPQLRLKLTLAVCWRHGSGPPG